MGRKRIQSLAVLQQSNWVSSGVAEGMGEKNEIECRRD